MGISILVTRHLYIETAPRLGDERTGRFQYIPSAHISQIYCLLTLQNSLAQWTVLLAPSLHAMEYVKPWPHNSRNWTSYKFYSKWVCHWNTEPHLVVPDTWYNCFSQVIWTDLSHSIYWPPWKLSVLATFNSLWCSDAMIWVNNTVQIYSLFFPKYSQKHHMCPFRWAMGWPHSSPFWKGICSVLYKFRVRLGSTFTLGKN